MRGMFERMIRSMKRSLRKALGYVRANNQELFTTLKEIENSLNSRSLTVVYHEELLQHLTSNKLLCSREITINN